MNHPIRVTRQRTLMLSGDFHGREMNTRAWLLLKHLEVWRKWNEEEGNELYKRINMDQIVLLGHSRGGEAVAIAATFNKLPSFPGNASLKFNFDFKKHQD